MCRHIQCKWKIPISADSNSLKRQRLSNKNTKTRHEKHTFELLFMAVQETPQTLWAIVVATGYLQEVEGKSLMLKTSCTSETRPGSFMPDLT